jgi:hypothetical protein
LESAIRAVSRSDWPNGIFDGLLTLHKGDVLLLA